MSWYRKGGLGVILGSYDLAFLEKTLKVKPVLFGVD